MRCTRIHFDGYKRLADTGCNVDGPIIAFVGLNEAGKSSLLEGLVWLTDDTAGALPVTFINRSRTVADNGVVVAATYQLEQSDLDLLSDLDFLVPPTTMTLQRRRNGTLAHGFVPWPKRNPAPFGKTRTRLAATRKRLESRFSTAIEMDDESTVTANAWATTIDQALAQPEQDWTDEVADVASSLIEWLLEVPPTSRSSKPRDEQTAEAIRAVWEIATSKHPRDVGRERLLERVPRFVLFRDEDRELATVHTIHEDVRRANPQPSLRNLLKIAELDIDRLWGYMATDDDSNQESYIEEANENLEEFYRQAWNQSNVAVRLKVDAKRLEVRLKELGRRGAVTNIEERSDGLRTFIALSAFLAAQHLDVPPILLIDEAETHLHYDAQADLVGVLLKNVKATQVFYTTHSPGCLPTDLGTSIRLLSKHKDQRDASTIKADFWTNQEPGFAPLLYAMGASAAAFSACRRAVLSEGPADMVLLPTLIRLATGKEDLDYQIAPGLSNAHAYDMNVEEVAAKVVYLADGDPGGDTHQNALLKAGVAPDRIFRLPSGAATEDLIDSQQYIEIVNEMLPAGVAVTSDDLAGGQTIAKALQDWAQDYGTNTPGHVAVAYAVVKRGDNIRLTPAAKKALIQLDSQFNAAFAKTTR
jgi:predicted ATP-dependent endonuclease of OLD family